MLLIRQPSRLSYRSPRRLIVKLRAHVRELAITLPGFQVSYQYLLQLAHPDAGIRW
jgi:hypothetical protein